MATKKTTDRKQQTEKAKRKTLVLLDAHAILHRAYHALPDFTSPTGEPTGALFGVVSMLLKIVEELKPDFIAACYDLPEPTYRHEVFEGYKAKRPEIDEALVAQINRSRDIFAAFGIRIFEHPGFEADDMLGTIVEQVKKEKALRTIIASGDMDTLQLVDDDRVLVYTLRKGIKDTILYDEDAVVTRFGFGPELIPDFKGLRGDPSDNIPGIRGIGEKGASELIINFRDIESIYKTLKKGDGAFTKAGIKARTIELLKANEEEAVFSKMLATIRRDAPITFTLPEETWREKLDVDRILTLFGELGFRTLASRVKTLFGEGTYEERSEATEAGAAIDPQELERTAIALWLLSSETTNPTLDDIIAYGRARGAPTFEAAREGIFAELKKSRLGRVYQDIELPLIEVLHTMEQYGVLIDVPYLQGLSTKMHGELANLEKRIHAHAGAPFNINSPKQLGDVLYDKLGLTLKHQKRTATGQRSTRESELEKLVSAHPIVREVLRYREVQKLVSTYIDPIPTLVAKDGRLHTTFLQAGSATGRMASKDPGIQNIPIRTDEGRAIRRAFIAEKGWCLVSIDYSQIELRIAAFLSGDEKLIEIFKRGEDVHAGVASRVFHVAPDAVTLDMRRRAKVINFGILYGMGVNALRANLGEEVSRAEAQEFLSAYFNTFTQLAEYLEETKAIARRQGYTETYFGRRRYFPGMSSSAPMIRAQAERMAINAPIQGTAADIIRIAMVRIHEHLTGGAQRERARMLIQVHDELVFEVREDAVAEVVPTLVSLMEGILTLKETNGVPLLVEAKVGKNWEEMHAWKK
jgi:DNA polymerase-1